MRDAARAALHRDKAAHLNALWGVGAKQARYSDDGTWYKPLERFPAALFDAHGFILFATEAEYLAAPMGRGKQVGVPKPGISAMPGYVRFAGSGALSVSHPFVVGELYSRKDVGRLLGLQPEKIRGIWTTGHVRHEDDWFVFANVQSAGTTGHNYNNRWIDGKLHWSAKRGRRLEHKSIQSLLSARVFIFTREDTEQPFVFRGIGVPAKAVEDTVPVQVVWKFETVTPPAVRILPMDSKKKEFPDWSVEDVQTRWFLGEMPSSPHPGRYQFRERGLDAESGTVVLFQFASQVVASGVFLKSELYAAPDGPYRGALWFDPRSIQVFEPVSADVVREIWPKFTNFSHVMQRLDPRAYCAFEARLRGVVKSPRNDEATHTELESIPPATFRTGAGYGTPEQNRQVEVAAISFVRNWYAQQGWCVESVEGDRCGFDLRCSGSPGEEHVEVKGVSGSEQTFIITAGELGRARSDPNFRICVITAALSAQPIMFRYSAEEFLETFALEPAQYRAVLRGHA